MNETIFKLELCENGSSAYSVIVPKRAKFLSLTRDDGKVYVWFTGNKYLEEKVVAFVSFKEGEETLCSNSNGIIFVGHLEGKESSDKLFFFMSTTEVDTNLKSDSDNIGCFFGWGVLKKNPWSLHGVYISEDKAKEALKCLPSEYEIAYGSHRIGGDDFLVSLRFHK